MPLRSDVSVEALQQAAQVGLPALLGLQVVSVAEGAVADAPAGRGAAARAERIPARRQRDRTGRHRVRIACIAHLPEGAASFTTIELKTNFLGTATTGSLLARAHPVHLGRTTQVWDASVSHVESGRTIAEFRCTQLVLWPKAGNPQ